jgi:hypothetical protein
MVTVTGLVGLSNNGDWTGNVIISGLPFLSATTVNADSGVGSVYMRTSYS